MSLQKDHPHSFEDRIQVEFVNMPVSESTLLQQTLGASFIGQLFNTMLTGVESVQMNYWNKDNTTFKLFVGFVIAIDMLSSVMGVYSTYWYLIVNYGNVQNLGYRLWALTIQTIVNAIPGCAVQLYYTRRVYLVSQRIIFPIILVPMILGGALVGIVITAMAAVIKENSRVHISLWLPRTWMGLSVLVDVLITAALSWALYRKRTGFARTDSMIKTLVAYTINSGFLVAALGTAMTVSFAVAISKYYYVAFFVVMSKCYVNALLAMLNTRDYVRDRSTANNPSTAYNLSSIRLESPSEAYRSTSRQPGVNVTVHRSTISDFSR